MSTTLLMPAAAADHVCHEEQLRVWAHDNLIGALALGGFLRDDLSYGELIELEATVARELKIIIGSAFDHPAATTIVRLSSTGAPR